RSSCRDVWAMERVREEVQVGDVLTAGEARPRVAGCPFAHDELLGGLLLRGRGSLPSVDPAAGAHRPRRKDGGSGEALKPDRIGTDISIDAEPAIEDPVRALVRDLAYCAHGHTRRGNPPASGAGVDPVDRGARWPSVLRRRNGLV